MERCPDCGEYNTIIHDSNKGEWECWMCGYTITDEKLKAKEGEEITSRLDCEEDPLEMAGWMA